MCVLLICVCVEILMVGGLVVLMVHRCLMRVGHLCGAVCGVVFVEIAGFT